MKTKIKHKFSILQFKWFQLMIFGMILPKMIIIEVLILKIIYPRNILYYSLVNYLKKIHILHISLKLIWVFSRISLTILPHHFNHPFPINCV